MIIGNISDSERYNLLMPYLKEAFEFIRSKDLKDLNERRYEINGDQLYCIISRQMGKKQNEAKLEFHRKYIDIHYTISGSDTIGWKPVINCTSVEQEYDDKKDFGLYSDSSDSWITLLPGYFAVFFPEDAHAPLVSEGTIHKAVIKIADNRNK